MPSTVPASLVTHLLGEVTTLATLWKIERTDGQAYYFTDHDKPIVYEGNTYDTGFGYNRSAINEKADMSVDNLDITGVIDNDQISREDVRGGRFDRAKVTLTVVDHTNPAGGGIIKRVGWFGNVKQTSDGEFDVELRGLSQTLQESLTTVYTPSCRVDLGSRACAVPLLPTDRAREDATEYRVGDYITVEGTDYIFQCTQRGETADASSFDPYPYWDSYLGDSITDGTAVFVTKERHHWDFTIETVTDRRTFSIFVPSNQTATDPTYFNGGLIRFTSGRNNLVALEVDSFTENTDETGDVVLFLRAPFEIAVGDTGTIYPGCDKSVGTCLARFNNVRNFRGFPHLPGDKYLKDYPDSKN